MTTSNPLLQRHRLPGETIRLLSGGLFYEDGVLSDDVTDGEVHVFPMNTYHEILMRSGDSVYNGNAVRTVIGECIPQILQPGELHSKDVDQLLAFLRVVTYGNEMELITTHGCVESQDKAPQKTTVNIRQMVTSAVRLDPSTVGDIFNYTVPSGMTVSFKPVSFNETLDMDHKIFMMTTEEIEGVTNDDEDVSTSSAKKLANMMIDGIVSGIVSVDEITNKQHIKEWLGTLPADWMSGIIRAFGETGYWGVDLQVETECPHCGEVYTTEVHTNPASFFI